MLIDLTVTWHREHFQVYFSHRLQSIQHSLFAAHSTSRHASSIKRVAYPPYAVPSEE